MLRCPGDARCVLTWVNLPDLRHYSQELAFYGPADRVTIRFPSPFLRNEPTTLLVEGMEDGTAWETSLIVSYEEAFKRELVHFHECIVEGRAPLMSGQEGRQDLIVLQAMARTMMSGQPSMIG